MSYFKSIFFIPAWYEDYEEFTHRMQESELWKRTDPKKVQPRYLLHYAAHIADDCALFSSYTLNDCAHLNIHMFEAELKKIPSLEEVRFSCFSTGVGFMEFRMSYDNATPEEVSDFAYRFKKAKKREDKILPEGKSMLYDVAISLLPKEARCELFFSATAYFKCECSCYHFLHIDGNPPEQEALHGQLLRLSRSYKSDYSSFTASDYDMLYEPSANDYWGCSSEGLANIIYDANHNDENVYLHKGRPSHMEIDYYFLYLLLLNQKFTAIAYIGKVAKSSERGTKEVEDLNRRIIRLKNIFSFNVISDDRVFQNVYAKLYTILEIRNLLEDVIENEGQMEILQNAAAVRSEKITGKFMIGLSVLSLFSALIDAASYLDRFQQSTSFNTVAGLFLVAVIVAGCVIWTVHSMK